MSQNGDEESREAMINPVQRRESSASRFLKHFRADRTNPAYHSEGKGLRKRRQPWNSERQLSSAVAGVDPSKVVPVTGNAAAAAATAPVTKVHSCSSNFIEFFFFFNYYDCFIDLINLIIIVW